MHTRYHVLKSYLVQLELEPEDPRCKAIALGPQNFTRIWCQIVLKGDAMLLEIVLFCIVIWRWKQMVCYLPFISWSFLSHNLEQIFIKYTCEQSSFCKLNWDEHLSGQNHLLKWLFMLGGSKMTLRTLFHILEFKLFLLWAEHTVVQY